MNLRRTQSDTHSPGLLPGLAQLGEVWKVNVGQGGQAAGELSSQIGQGGTGGGSGQLHFSHSSQQLLHGGGSGQVGGGVGSVIIRAIDSNDKFGVHMLKF